MSIEVIAGIVGIGVLLILMMLGLPIAICMGLIAVLGTWYLMGPSVAMNGISSVLWDKSYDFVLSTIPMFVLMGYFVYFSGISKELFDTFKACFGRVRGGLALAVIAACGVFAAATGSSVAAAATMGVICLPELEQSRYDKRLAAGAVAAGGTLGILIPPSTVLIIYGILTEQSIGTLFIAGIIPGILLAFFFMVTVVIVTRMKPHFAPKPEKQVVFRLKDIKGVGGILLLFVVVIGGIYLGVMTPTEAAGVGACGAFFIALFRKKLTFKKSVFALTKTLSTTCFIFAIIMGAFLLNYFMAITKIPLLLANLTSSLNLPPVMILIFIIFIYLFLGCVMDALAMVVLTMPIFFPTIIALGFDPIWFGIIVVVVFELALITPPVGMNCYILSGVAKGFKMEQIFNGVAMFIPALLLTIILLILVPSIALFLPSTMGLLK